MPISFNRASKLLRSTEASEIAEAAIVMPVVFLFLLGIIWFGRAFNIYSTIQQAAQQGALLAARPDCATCATRSPRTTRNDVEDIVAAVMSASSVDPHQIIPGTAIPGVCRTTRNYKITVCPEAQLNPPSFGSSPANCAGTTYSTPSSICGTLVTFQYPFQFNLPFTSLNLTRVVLTAQAQSHAEN